MSADDPAILARVAAQLDGWPVDLEFTIAPARLPAALKKLAALGYEPRQPAAAPAAAPKAQRPRAKDYDGNGDPLCPIHFTPMREGRHGWYCPKQALTGQPANAKGYCSAVADD